VKVQTTTLNITKGKRNFSMLLACCFREANKKSTKKRNKTNGKYQKIKENEVRKMFVAAK
jgi:hypothetical protein